MPGDWLRQSLGDNSNAPPQRGMLRTCAIAFCFFAVSEKSVHAVCKGEAETSRANAMQIEQEWPLRPTQDRATRYLQSLGERLVNAETARQSRRRYDWPEDSWHFSLVRNLSVNAFSIGDGRVYVTDGSITFVNSEAELSAILAHEIAHQLAGHFCAGNRSNTGDYRQIGSLVQVVDNAKEMQADSIALNILRNAGFPASAMLEIVKRLPLSGNSRQQEQRIEALLHDLHAPGDTRHVQNSPEFDAIKEELR